MIKYEYFEFELNFFPPILPESAMDTAHNALGKFWK